MRVMYFAFEGFDTPNGTNHLAIKMIDYLLKEGIQVHLMSSHTRGVNPDIPEILQNREGFTYDIVNRKVVNKQNFVQRYLDGISYAFKCKKKWMEQRNEIDVVLLQSTPTVFFSSMLLRLFFRKPVVFNSFDVFPNVAYDTGALNSKLVFSMLLMLQKMVYRNCDKIIVISSDMKRTLMSQNVPESKIVEIKNWYDDETVRLIDRDKNAFIKKYGISDRYFYVQYAGNFGFTFNYRYILNVAEKLKTNPNIRLQMIGEGAFADAFVAEAKQRGLDNIDFYPWQPSSIIADVYSSCDVSLIPLSSGVIRNSFPSKGSLLMACGKVILCATEPESDYYRMINENEVGICVSNKDEDQAVEAILRLYTDREYWKKLGQNAKIFGVTHYSSSNNLPKFKEILKKYEKT